MDQTREDRMRSRMRGAARHQVQDADFGDLFSIPALAPEPQPELEPEPESSDPSVATSPDQEPSAEPPPLPEPAPAPTQHAIPNTSVKRRRLDSEGIAGPTVRRANSPKLLPSATSSSANRSSRRVSRAAPPRDPYDLDGAPSTVADTETIQKSTPRNAATAQQPTGSARSAGPSSVLRAEAPPQSSPLSALRSEEVTESPADAPGSGHRRRIRPSGAITSSALLQSALRSVDDDTNDGFLQSSSPLSRKSRKTGTVSLESGESTRRSLRRSSRLSGSPEETNELSSDLPVVAEEEETVHSPEEHHSQREEVELEIPESVLDDTAADAPEEPEEPGGAEEVEDIEAAHRLGRKRQRVPELSPELAHEKTEKPRAKRARKTPIPKRSPAKQRQPKAPRTKQSRPPAPRKKNRGNDEAQPIEVRVQRFTKGRGRSEDDADEDILSSDIPYANRSDVNAVDVLANLCEDLIEYTSEKFLDTLNSTQDAALKKELRVKVTALNAFQEELRTRFLQHTIALDTLYALKRRVRDAQKEKLKLRERIIEIRAEREQVALRMDAVRTKHEEDRREALYNMNLSAAMHDVDLAIEQGRAAPELSPQDQKTADLANLEFMISKMAEKACSNGPRGGVLQQIKSFNAFLERAAAAV